jgi:competence protein ComEC
VGESPCGRELDALPGVARRVVAAGDRLRVGRWRLRILHPAAGRDGAGRRATGGSNDASLVIIAEVFGRRLLLTGDVEAAGERRLLREAPEALRADLLKVAHHGSRTSTSRRFLDAVSPRVALVSAGARNPYGHPAEEVLARFEERRIPIFRTDRHGMIAIRIRPDGTLFIRLPADPKGAPKG